MAGNAIVSLVMEFEAPPSDDFAEYSKIRTICEHLSLASPRRSAVKPLQATTIFIEKMSCSPKMYERLMKLVMNPDPSDQARLTKYHINKISIISKRLPGLPEARSRSSPEPCPGNPSSSLRLSTSYGGTVQEDFVHILPSKIIQDGEPDDSKKALTLNVTPTMLKDTDSGGTFSAIINSTSSFFHTSKPITTTSTLDNNASMTSSRSEIIKDTIFGPPLTLAESGGKIDPDPELSTEGKRPMEDTGDSDRPPRKAKIAHTFESNTPPGLSFQETEQLKSLLGKMDKELKATADENQKLQQTIRELNEKLYSQYQEMMRAVNDERRRNTLLVEEWNEKTAELRLLKQASQDEQGEIRHLRQELTFERNLRLQAEKVVEDVQRELKDPFIVPGLLDAFVLFSKSNRSE